MQNCLSCSARATPDIKQMGVTWDKKIHYSTRVEQIKGLQIAWSFLKSKRIDSASVPYTMIVSLKTLFRSIKKRIYQWWSKDLIYRICIVTQRKSCDEPNFFKMFFLNQDLRQTYLYKACYEFHGKPLTNIVFSKMWSIFSTKLRMHFPC